MITSGMQKTGTSVRLLVVEAKETGKRFALMTARKRWKTLYAMVLLPFIPLETLFIM